MPDGVMRWFDPRTGEAEVVRGGRTFPARAGDIETEARRPGARVHFDIRRVQGVEEAVEVRLRPGARVSHHHHRFGTLTGARRIDTKGPAPYAQVHPELRLAEVHPLEVARAWATSVAHGDIPGSIALYSADAVLHVADQPLVGRSAIGGWLTGSPLLGSAHHARIRGEEGTVAVSWGATGPDEPGMVVHCRIAHAQIVEQWVSQPEPPATSVAGGRAHPFRVELSTRGDVGDDAKTGAQEAILRVVAELDEPVLFARVKLAWEPDPARPRPAVAQVALDVNGDLVRAHVAAHTMPEAIDLLVRRLRDRLAHRATYREQAHRREAIPRPGEWRHGDLPTSRPAYFDRPVEDRQLVRHKTFALGELIPDEAVFDMEQLDDDFYLFCDVASGSDSMIERLEDGSYRLTRVNPSDADLGLIAARVEVATTPAPVLTLDEAIEHLDTGGERHVFFANATTGRGNVLYRRYDGHYGLITSD